MKKKVMIIIKDSKRYLFSSEAGKHFTDDELIIFMKNKARIRLEFVRDPHKYTLKERDFQIMCDYLNFNKIYKTTTYMNLVEEYELSISRLCTIVYRSIMRTKGIMNNMELIK